MRTLYTVALSFALTLATHIVSAQEGVVLTNPNGFEKTRAMAWSGSSTLGNASIDDKSRAIVAWDESGALTSVPDHVANALAMGSEFVGITGTNRFNFVVRQQAGGVEDLIVFYGESSLSTTELGRKLGKAVDTDWIGPCPDTICDHIAGVVDGQTAIIHEAGTSPRVVNVDADMLWLPTSHQAFLLKAGELKFGDVLEDGVNLIDTIGGNVDKVFASEIFEEASTAFRIDNNWFAWTESGPGMLSVPGRVVSMSSAGILYISGNTAVVYNPVTGSETTVGSARVRGAWDRNGDLEVESLPEGSSTQSLVTSFANLGVPAVSSPVPVVNDGAPGQLDDGNNADSTANTVNLGSGGCTLARQGTTLDPMFLLLIAVATLGMFRKRLLPA